jgi:hypothetical protein
MSFSHLKCHLNVINDKMVGIGWFRTESVHASAARRVVQRDARPAAMSTVIATKRYGVTAEVAATAQRDVANSSPRPTHSGVATISTSPVVTLYTIPAQCISAGRPSALRRTATSACTAA